MTLGQVDKKGHKNLLSKGQTLRIQIVVNTKSLSVTLFLFFLLHSPSLGQQSFRVRTHLTFSGHLPSFNLKCLLNSGCSVPVYSVLPILIKYFRVMQQLQQWGSVSDVEASRIPVTSLLCPGICLHGKEKHNKLQSRLTEEFPQPLSLWGQIIINHRFKNSVQSEWMPFSAHFSPPASDSVPRACMVVCRLGL